VHAQGTGFERKRSLLSISSWGSKRWATSLGLKDITPRGPPDLIRGRLEGFRENVKCIVFAMHLAFPNPYRAGIRARKARVGLFDLLRKLFRVSLTRGVDAFVKLAKDFAADARRQALGDMSNVSGPRVLRYFRGLWDVWAYHPDERRRMLLQFSSFTRALGLPSRSVVERAITGHKKTLTSEFYCGQGDRRSFGAFCEAWSERLKPTVVGYGTITASASYDTKRAQGGALSELKRLADEYRSSPCPTDLDSDPLAEFRMEIGPARISPRSYENQRPNATREEVEFLYDTLWAEDHGVNLGDWEVLRELLFLQEACLRQVVDVLKGHRLPRCRQTVVRTRGYKARIVTSIEAAFVYLCRTWQHILEAGLRRWGPLREVMEGRKTDSILSFLDTKPEGDVYIRSVDLTEATDRIPLDLMEGGVQAIIGSLGLPPNSWLSRVLHASVGPFDMLCDDGETVVTRRGILMGLPTSWPLLCLYNAWLADTAVGRPRSKRAGLRMSLPYRICGDDMIAWLSYTSSKRYDEVLTRTGGSVSVGKDYLCPKAGLFLEIGFTAEGKIMDVVPVKGLIPYPSSIGVPLWVTAGPTLVQALGTTARKEPYELVRYTCASIVRKFRRAGLNPYSPRFFGGAGLPPPRKDMIVSTDRRVSRAIRVLMSGQMSDLETLECFETLGSVWRYHLDSDQSRFHSEIRGEAWTLLKASLARGLPNPEIFDVSEQRPNSIRILDLIEGVCRSWVSSYALARGVGDSSLRKKGMSKIASDLRRVVREINDRVPRNRLRGRTKDLLKGWVRFQERIEGLSISKLGWAEFSSQL